MQLHIDPAINAHLVEAFDISLARTKRQPVQRVNGALLLTHLPGLRGFLFFPGERELRRRRKGHQ
jgi:hypothetical protein